MTEDDSVLEGKISDVKDKINNLKDPNYKNLLNREEEGKDRKGVKEFLQSKINSSETSVEPKQEKTSLSNQTYFLAGAGVLVGLLVGLAAGQTMMGSSIDGNPQTAQDNLRQFIESSGFNGTTEVGQPAVRNGMYYFNVSLTGEGPNGTTRTNYQTAFVTKDGVLLFPERPLMNIPINMEQVNQRQSQTP